MIALPVEKGTGSGQGFRNDPCSVARAGLLRNSTKIAAQFSGLDQCSQKAPGASDSAKRGPDCFENPAPCRRPALDNNQCY